MNVVRTALFGAMGSFLFAACTDAGGKVQGGDPVFDAAPPPPFVPPPVDAGFMVGTGIKWSDLYADYFGRVTGGGPGCSGTGTRCHGGPMDSGALGSGGYVCGHDKDACFAGIKTMIPGNALVQATDMADPTSSRLIKIELRSTVNPNGSMPQAPASFVFKASDIKRISDWIAAGAMNN
jgi:hypothetical protein